VAPCPDSSVEGSALVLPVRDARAGKLRTRYHACFSRAELPVPVESIAADLLGLHVEEGMIQCSGMLVVAERRIVLRNDETQARRRFTLAHEVGHWVCHVLEGRVAPAYCRSEDVAPGAERTLEREANLFAAELLMPEAAVRAASTDEPQIEQVATRFAVSAEAMHWRLYNLGLAAAGPRATGQ
jgi:hypothetical protein